MHECHGPDFTTRRGPHISQTERDDFKDLVIDNSSLVTWVVKNDRLLAWPGRALPCLVLSGDR